MASSDGFRMAAIDPGVTTGWALLEDDRVVSSGQVLAESVRVDWRRAELEAVRSIVGIVGRVDGWACEDFILRGRSASRDALSPVRVAAMLFAVVGTGVPWWWVSPSDAKSVVTDERLRAWDAWVVGKHARDAVRVGLVAHRRRQS